MAPTHRISLRARARHILRRTSRLRWLTKRGILANYGVVLREQPGMYLRYLLWDPEVESYSYDIANDDELCAFGAAHFGVTQDVVRGYLEEARTDPELTVRLSRRVRWRFDVKHRLPVGNRLLWYVAARATKPALIVETGIYEGLGSLVLLRALERNAEDSVDGRLVSVDIDPASGFLVAPRLRDRWTKLTGSSDQELERAIGPTERVGLLLQDTPHTEENQRWEFDFALRHAARRLVLIEGSGGYCPTMGELAAHLGIELLHFREKPRDHFYPAPGQQLVVVEDEVSAGWSGWDGRPMRG